MSKKFLFLLFPVMQQAFAQVCPTATNNSQYNQTTNLGGAGENPTTNPFTYTYVAGTGANRLMILIVTYETENNNGPNNFGTVQYGGVALTNVVNQTVVLGTSQRNRLAIYYLNEAGITARVGNTVNIPFTNPGGTSPNGSINGVAVNTLLFENVNQATPLLNIQSATNTNTVTITVPAPFTATAGNFIIASVNMALATATVGPATPDYSVYISQQVTGSHTHAASFKQIVTTGLEQPGFTANISTRQIIGSVEIRALTIGGSCGAQLVPVRIVSFSGNGENDKVKLMWKTENEINIHSYNIQRNTSSGSGFTTIGNTQARNLSLPSQYVFNDLLPLPGNSFYRLEIIGSDGRITYSNTIRINKETQTDISVFPHFTSSILITAGSLARQDAYIKLYDLSGKSVLMKEIILERGMNSLQVPVEHFLTPGLYFVTLYTGHQSRSFKIMKE